MNHLRWFECMAFTLCVRLTRYKKTRNLLNILMHFARVRTSICKYFTKQQRIANQSSIGNTINRNWCFFIVVVDVIVFIFSLGLSDRFIMQNSTSRHSAQTIIYYIYGFLQIQIQIYLNVVLWFTTIWWYFYLGLMFDIVKISVTVSHANNVKIRQSRQIILNIHTPLPINSEFEKQFFYVLHIQYELQENHSNFAIHIVLMILVVNLQKLPYGV